ncbi:c-type cytochrome [Flammeovirga agarivorans]|uniref:Cytochrome c n=1 Tax=Flammeovirga agarivorans TaxID=2726742 RepID=A0A7X8SHH5_9BACT|nr:cytochrome c [Flammeovirga agarivorans]NLR90341.1 cytochrome c [Flammeovirga agarivorans]
MSHVILTHRIVVSLFFLIYLIKTILLFVNQGSFEKFRKVIKVPEMIVSFSFLATGLYMIFASDIVISTALWIKFGLVVASIPLAVIATKKSNKVMMLGSLLCLTMAYGMAEMHKAKQRKAMTNAPAVEVSSEGLTEIEKQGQKVYGKTCLSCHGPNGDAQRSGAAKLSESELDLDGIKNVVRNGKGVYMPEYNKTQISDSDLEALANYVLTLRK